MSSPPSQPDDGPIQPHRQGATIDLLVQPRASRSGVDGVQGGLLKVRITAPPVDGAANAAVIDVFAELLGLRRSDVTILSGQRGRRKRVLVHGVSPEHVAQRLLHER